MNCPRCGKPLPGGAAFCMHCGQMLSGAPGPVAQSAYGPAVAIAPDVRKRNTILAIVISAILLLIVFFGLRASGVLGASGKTAERPSLQAQGTPPNPTLRAQGTGPTPTLEAQRVTMPQDIYDWLNHLARCEKKKEALTAQQVLQAKQMQAELQGASGLTSPEDVDKLSDPDYNSFPSIDKITAMLNQLQPDWVTLKKEFDSVPPPQECKPIAESYDNGLQNMIDVFASVEKLVGGISLTDQNSIRKSADDVKQVGLNHRRGIDGEFQSTDDLVQQICDKYQTRKWFKIDAHGGTSGLLGY